MYWSPLISNQVVSSYTAKKKRMMMEGLVLAIGEKVNLI